MTELAVIGEDRGEMEQLILSGFPIERGRTRFSLSNDKKLLTEQELRYNQSVSGTFEGRVKGLQHVEIAGELHAVFVVEVLSAELE